MKKIFICLLLIMSFITLTGCNEKKEKVEYVECSINQDAGDFILDTSIKVKIKEDKLDGASLAADYILSEENMKYHDIFYSELVKEFQNLEQQYGIKANVSKTDNGAKVTIDMTNEQLENMYQIDTDEKVTREEFIDEFELSGYTCK